MTASSNPTENFCVSQDENSIAMQSGLLSLKFGTSSRVTFDELYGCADTNWLSEFGDVGLLWKIHFIGPHGTSPVYSNNEADFVKAWISKDEEDIKEITFLWTIRATHDVHPGIEIKIRCEKGKALSYWSLKILNLPEGWKIRRVDFPSLSNLAVMKNRKVLVPAGWGIEYDLKPCFNYEGNYPSCMTGIQMVAFYDDQSNHGLYFSSHDPAANLKDFNIQAKEKSAILSQSHIPSIPEKHEDCFELGYEAVLGVFEGGYYEAGQIYREFAMTTRWVDEARRKPVPAWLKETELWLRPDGGAEKNLEITKEALKFFEVKTAQHWYRWHEIPYDTDYPEYLPALPGVAAAIKELHDWGSHVVLYINGRLWDPESKSWTAEKAYQYAARSASGDCYSEIYGSKIPNNVMCPYTEFWQEKVSDIAKSLEEVIGVHGVYIDQIAAARGVPCYQADHGHPVGGGEFWREGYEAMLEKTREKISDQTILLTEENAECWLNLLDAHLVVNTLVDGKVVPLFQSVYSGKTILIASLYYAKDEPQNSLAFRMKNAIAFLWGSQLGWIRPYLIMDPEVRAEAEFLKNLAKTRQYTHAFIDEGRFLGMLKVGGDNPILTGILKGPFAGQYEMAEPAVSASAWLSPDGRLGILMTNLSDEPHEVTLNLPLDKAGMAENKTSTAVDHPIKISHYNHTGLVGTKEYSGPNINLTIPERGGWVLEVR